MGDPIVIEVFEEIIGVQIDRLHRLLIAGDEALELGRIDPAGGGRVPLNGIAVNDQPRMLGIVGRQVVLEMVEMAPQIGAGGMGGEISPKVHGEIRARNRLLAPEHQESQHGQGFRRDLQFDGRGSQDYAQVAEQIHGKVFLEMVRADEHNNLSLSAPFPCVQGALGRPVRAAETAGRQALPMLE